MTKTKRLCTVLLAASLAFFASALLILKSTSVDASVRNKKVFEDKFESSVIDDSKWLVVEGEGENKVYTGYGGDEGTMTAGEAGGSWVITEGGFYNKTAVDVAAGESLIIEYDYLADGGAYYFGIIKGIQEIDGKPARSINDNMEIIMAMTNNQTMLGYFDANIGGNISESNRSDALKSYLATSAVRQKSYTSDSGEWTYSVNLKSGISGTPVYSFRTVGYTYKHVFLPTGGYECYAKTIGGGDSEYVLILKTADTYAEDTYHGTNGAPADEKIFRNLSGRVGFVSIGERVNRKIEIDNFKVSVKGSEEGAETEVKVSEDFNRNGAANPYKPEEHWAFFQGGEFNCNYPTIGMVLDDPANDNYLYSTTNVMLINSGVYDNYVKFSTDFIVNELGGNKQFGVIFGGMRSSDKLAADGNVFVYLFVEDGSVFLAADKVVGGERVRAGEPVRTNIPLDSLTEQKTVTLNITGMLGGKINAEILIDGTKDAEASFGSKEVALSLQNRFGFITEVTEGKETENDVAKISITYIVIENKWLYQVEEGETKSVVENFDAVDADGDPYINEDDLFIINKKGGYSSDKDAGIYVKDGQLKFVSGGHGGGVAVRYAYNNWKMSFDITDMQRKVLYADDGETVIRTVCNAPMIICFGLQAEGVGYTTGKALTINFSTTLDGEHVARITEPGYERSEALTTVNTEIIGIQGNIGTMVKEGYARHQFIDPALDGYTIRVQVEYKDGRLTLGYVVIGLEDYDLLYDPVLIYENVEGEGYVGISTTHTTEGNFQGTFTLDNLRVIDTDENSAIKDDVVPQPEPTPDEPDNPDPVVPEKKETNVAIIVVVGVVALVVGAAAGVFVTVFINKKKNKRA